MSCEEIREQLGPYLDNELPGDVREGVVTHVATCASCRAELEALRGLESDLAGPGGVRVPDTLWTSIEHRLESDSQASPVILSGWRWQGHRARWAVAAAVVLAVGLGAFGRLWTGSTAQASAVDFSVLLDALPLNAQKAFRKFLVLYDAKPSSPTEARRYAPDLNFDIPEELPGGFRLEAVYVLRFGKLSGVAATYDRDGEFLGTVFHRPMCKEHFGPHRDFPCMVGRHEGHKVSVGEWKLVHLMDPTTCHCVLSRLDERTELPAVMAAVAPGLPASKAGRE